MKPLQGHYIIHLFVLLVSTVLFIGVCVADELPLSFLTLPAQPTIGITMPKYAGARIGDIAPQFTLPKLNGTVWSSLDQLGQHVVLLLFIGESPVLIGKSTAPESVVNAIVQTAQTLRESGVEVIVISRAVGINLNGINKQFDALCLRDEKGDLSSFFSPSPTEMTLVAIDKAGFLRRIETVHEPQTIGDRIRRVGNLASKLEVGKPAPDFSISDMNGRVRRLSALRGQKNLLLTFFPKCFTGGCANHLTSLQESRNAFEASDTEIWAISVDPAAGEQGQLAFAASLGLKFPLIPDTGRNLSLLYQAARKPYSRAWRRTMLIDKGGVLRFIDKSINVFTHGPDMLAKVRELGLAK